MLLSDFHFQEIEFRVYMQQTDLNAANTFEYGKHVKLKCKKKSGPKYSNSPAHTMS